MIVPLSRAAVVISTIFLTIAAPSALAAHHRTSPSVEEVFSVAAQRSHVPLLLLVAVSWEQSLLTDLRPVKAGGGPYGFMGLVDRPGNRSLIAASSLVHVSPGMLISRNDLNILGGALLLEKYGHDTAPPHGAVDWSGAVLTFMHVQSPLAARITISDIDRVLRRGVSHSGVTISAGSRIRLAIPAWVLRRRAGTSYTGRADYSGATWAPAAPANFTRDSRPVTHAIRLIVIHDTESSCPAALNTFQDPSAGVSPHYLVCRDGTVYQTVHEKDVAWHAGNWPINQQSIGIEHEGVEGKRLYTHAEYVASSKLVDYLTQKYGLNPNRNVIVGHENVPLSDHTDPGSTWDWPLYMRLIRHDGSSIDVGTGEVRAIRGTAFIRACPLTTCRLLGTANWGEQYFVQSHRGAWIEIYYGGRAGWVRRGITSSGTGFEVQITQNTHVFGADRPHAAAMGTAAPGQVYVSLTPINGYWWIYFQDRYGFVPRTAAQIVNCDARANVLTSNAACQSELGLWSKSAYLQSLAGLNSNPQ